MEKKVASWLRRLGFETKIRDRVKGKRATRGYEIDVHAWAEKKRIIGSKRIDIWVECKALKTTVKRTHVFNFLEKARDLRDAFDDNIEEWFADILMIVSTSGFDHDAIKFADDYGIYLVHYTRTYKFIGEMTREDLLELRESNY